MKTPDTKTDAATPRPWKLNQHLCVWACCDDSLVARIAGPNDDDKESQANAALIVRAVNLLEAHEAVVRLAKWISESPKLDEAFPATSIDLKQALAHLAKLKEANK